MRPAPLPHGGRLNEAVRKFGGTRSSWLDLSTGINPSAYPVPDLPPALWHRLPEEHHLLAAAEAARGAYEAPDAAISVAPGSQMHIQMLPFLWSPRRVAVIGPTYAEHAACWARAGHDVVTVDGLAAAETVGRIVVVVNPNNPDGRTLRRSQLLDLARRLGARGGALVVDEAFADVASDASVAGRAGREGLVVLRSLGKFYGLAGARVGFALTTREIAARLDDMLGPWAVPGPSLHVAAAALDDRTWARRARQTLARRSEALDALLDEFGLERIGGTDLFTLVSDPRAGRIDLKLRQQHVLVRSFREARDRLRFGIPGGQRPLARLREALETVLG